MSSWWGKDNATDPREGRDGGGPKTNNNNIKKNRTSQKKTDSNMR